MAKRNNKDADIDVRLGRRVSQEVSVLLNEIEKEPVPDRLLDLAMELQKALADNLEKQPS
ncbi:hypothetical protein ABID21_003153 [Pseudorhizobium tarimense]|uniref:Anti-sigma factor NepR domain-containing protein n=2 Tax=Pseudorhizobium tarimense TaxID=1079109 RepID=A0ABV2H901_9HYPH|nr:hypothetical protein [Pseudorhizobium tarimense]MCJ8520153.1 hypothetical protein [Pseudorhizobium tarimense]